MFTRLKGLQVGTGSGGNVQRGLVFGGRNGLEQRRKKKRVVFYNLSHQSWISLEAIWLQLKCLICEMGIVSSNPKGL